MNVALIVVPLFLALSLIAFGYVLFLRPLFEAHGWVKPLPIRVVTWRDRIAASVWHSATIAVQAVVGLVGTSLAAAPMIGDWFNQPDINAQLAKFLSPTVFGGALVVIGFLTVLARLRSLFKGS